MEMFVEEMPYLDGLGKETVPGCLRNKVEKYIGKLGDVTFRVVYRERMTVKSRRPYKAKGGRIYRLVLNKGDKKVEWPADPRSFMTSGELLAALKNLSRTINTLFTDK